MAKKLTVEERLKSALEALLTMVVQADEDCPSEYRTKHFRTAMNDSISLLKKEKVW